MRSRGRPTKSWEQTSYAAPNGKQCCGFGSERIRINLQMTSQNVWNMSLFEHFLESLSLYLEARIWIRIRIRVKSQIRIRIKIKINPDQKHADPQHCGKCVRESTRCARCACSLRGSTWAMGDDFTKKQVRKNHRYILTISLAYLGCSSPSSSSARPSSSWFSLIWFSPTWLATPPPG